MKEGMKTRQPFFTWAAWLSLILPLVAVGVFLAVNNPQAREQRWIFAVFTLVFAGCFFSGCLSLAGVRRNGVWVILPPAVLGILLSAALGLLALCFWMLSFGPRSP